MKLKILSGYKYAKEKDKITCFNYTFRRSLNKASVIECGRKGTADIHLMQGARRRLADASLSEIASLPLLILYQNIFLFIFCNLKIDIKYLAHHKTTR